MRKFHIVLTEEEMTLVEAINLYPPRNPGDKHASYLANREPILTLVKSLIERGAIPKERLNYWDNAEYNTGRATSSPTRDTRSRL